MGEKGRTAIRPYNAKHISDKSVIPKELLAHYNVGSIFVTDENGAAWDIYAQKVVGTTAAQDLTFNVLKGQTVTVDKAADAYDGNILFNAYLTQATGFDTALAAWNATFGVKAA